MKNGISIENTEKYALSKENTQIYATVKKRAQKGPVLIRCREKLEKSSRFQEGVFYIRLNTL